MTNNQVSRTIRRTALVGMAAALLVTLGSCSYRTRWQTVIGAGTDDLSISASMDGIGEWAALTFTLGLFALWVLSGLWMRLSQSESPPSWWRRSAVGLVIVAACCLVVASVLASRYLLPLLMAIGAGPIRSGNDVTWLAYIALGLPVVAVSGIVGALVCVIFAFALYRSRLD